MQWFLVWIIGVSATFLLAAADRGCASEPLATLLDGRDARIDELEQAVAGLQQQIDTLQGSSTSEAAGILGSDAWSEICNSVPTSSGPPFSHGIIYDNGWTLRPFDPQHTPYELTSAQSISPYGLC